MTLERLRWLRLAFFSMMAAQALPNLLGFLAPLAAARLHPGDETAATATVRGILSINLLVAGVAYGLAAWFSARARSVVLSLLAVLMVLGAVAAGVLLYWELRYSPLRSARDGLELLWWLSLCVKLVEVRATRWLVAAAMLLTFAVQGATAMMSSTETTIFVTFALSALTSIASWALLAWAFRRASRALAGAP